MSPPQELRDLLAAADAQTRDAAWEHFVRAFSPLLLHTARTVNRDYDVAMDGYAFVLEQLRANDCRRLRAYAEQPDCRFSTWLVVVARRICHDRIRHRYGRHADRSAGDANRSARRRLEDLVGEQLDGAAPVVDPAPTADHRMGEADRSAALAASIARLSPAQRLLLAMRYEDERTAREIASLLGYPTPFHVYRAINNTLADLRKSLADRGFTRFES